MQKGSERSRDGYAGKQSKARAVDERRRRCVTQKKLEFFFYGVFGLEIKQEMRISLNGKEITWR